MTQINNFSARVLQFMQTKNVSEDEAKKQVQEEENKNNSSNSSQEVSCSENNEGSLEQLDYLSAINSLLVTNKPVEDGDNTIYSFTNSKSQTVTINGKKVKVTTGGATTKNPLKLTVDKDGKINIENNGVTSIKFDTTEDLNINVSKSTKNLSITGGSGNDLITVQEGVKIGTINGGKGNDIIVNAGTTTSISGGNENDIILNSGSMSTVYAGNGNDTIFNSGKIGKISGDSGDDNIINQGQVSSILGGTGDDNISNSGTVTNKSGLNGGNGNNTITNNGTLGGVLYQNNVEANGTIDGKYYVDGKLCNKTITTTSGKKKTTSTYKNGVLTQEIIDEYNSTTSATNFYKSEPKIYALKSKTTIKYDSDGYVTSKSVTSYTNGKKGTTTQDTSAVGFNKEGYNKEGYNKEGYDKNGFDKDGFNKEGYDKDGYNKEGYDKNGNAKETKDTQTINLYGLSGLTCQNNKYYNSDGKLANGLFGQIHFTDGEFTNATIDNCTYENGLLKSKSVNFDMPAMSPDGNETVYHISWIKDYNYQMTEWKNGNPYNGTITTTSTDTTDGAEVISVSISNFINGATTTTLYDNQNRIISIEEKTPDNECVSFTNYVYKDNNNYIATKYASDKSTILSTSEVIVNGSSTTTTVKDNKGRVLSENTSTFNSDGTTFTMETQYNYNDDGSYSATRYENDKLQMSAEYSSDNSSVTTEYFEDGRRKITTFDSSGKLLSSENVAGEEIALSTSSTNTTVDSDGKKTITYFDKSGKVSSILINYPNGNTEATAYYPDGKTPIYVKSCKNGDTTEELFDANGEKKYYLCFTNEGTYTRIVYPMEINESGPIDSSTNLYENELASWLSILKYNWRKSASEE